jgi:hypothetical protein
MKANKEAEIIFRCETPKCTRKRPVNIVTGITDVDAFMENWRPGDDDADLCPRCKEWAVPEPRNEGGD